MADKYITLSQLKRIVEQIKQSESILRYSLTNCDNCGAPVDCSRNTCEYCGSLYRRLLDNKKDEVEIHEIKATSLDDTTYEWTVSKDGKRVTIAPLHGRPTVDRSFLEYDRIQLNPRR